ncbi:ASCH domain-containing protein [Bacillus spongiae]|uniref:ASCH domain-containing protein n=1 Tax=Bacillus spongiae TaxID=2683610 RepID=A0ABU8HH53_9BACI
MKGLLIKSPWIDHILQGNKTWEIRGSNTNIRGKIALIKSGTGKVFGTADLIGCKKLSFEEYKKSEAFHLVPMVKDQTKPYKNIHAWVLDNPCIFKEPIRYHHPQGAVIWVNLPEELMIRDGIDE